MKTKSQTIEKSIEKKGTWKLAMMLISKLCNILKNNLALILLSLAVIIIVFYAFLIYPNPSEFYKTYKIIIEIVKVFAIVCFTGGIFSVFLKYVQYLNVFESEFERIINSENFKMQIKSNIEAFAFSKKFLNKQTNLDKIWKNVTIAKYRKRFPELKNKIIDLLENELFADDSLNSYYKDFILFIKLELLDDNYVKIEERASFTIIRDTEQEFQWKFSITVVNDSDEKTYPKLDLLKSTINGVKFANYAEYHKEEKMENNKIFKHILNLSGSKEYFIERHVEIIMNLNDDRVFSFSTLKIINYINVMIQFCDKLNVIFSKVGKNIFEKHSIHDIEHSYVNTNILLPGEKFKLFIFKK